MKGEQENFNIGIVGCGNISDTHAEAILQTKKGRLIAAYSHTRSKLNAFCDRHDISAYPSYEEFLANPDLDIVVICTPTGMHLDHGILAAKAGKHAIVEKPIEITVGRGSSLIKCCKKNNVKLAVIYQNRFTSSVIRMKKVIAYGDIGQPIMARASVKWFRSQAYYDDSSWRGTFALDGGGAVINQSIHTIDLLQLFMGPVESVAAVKGMFTHKIEAEDNATACLRFKNGAIGTFEASTSILPPQERKIEINGSKGTAFLEGDAFHKQIGASDKDDKSIGKKASSEPVGAASPLAGMTGQNHKKQYEQILDAFQWDRRPVVSGEESLQSLAIVQALYKSADRSEVVAIEEILPKEHLK
jgi:predicted dehydrogenase